MFPASPPQPQTTRNVTFPAPDGGINSIDSLHGMDSRDSIYTYNIDSSAEGAVVRPGYAEHTLPHPTTTPMLGSGVRTVMPFAGILEGNINDRLFAVTDDGIYDITSSGTIQVADRVVAWSAYSGTGGLAGWCSYTQYTTVAGVNHLLVCDQKNGYLSYSESTDSWTAGSVSGGISTASSLVFVMVWKHRIWLVERDSNNAYYFDTVGGIAGPVSKFTFGNKFKYGGFLQGLYNWSRDAGSGPDDYLVALSHGGDVVIYSGTDPSSFNTFGIVGVWFVGNLPTGRRVADEFGGDLLVLSSFGLVSTNALMQGFEPFSKEANLAWKISRHINQRNRDTKGFYGWEVKLHPGIKKIVVNSPGTSGIPYLQYVYDLDTSGWSFWRGVPIACSEEWAGDFYFGDITNQVWKVSGNLDNVLLTDTTPTASQPINFSLLTSFQDLGGQGVNKRAQYIRPMFISEGDPSYEVQARYDFDLTEADLASIAIVYDGALWDTAKWDSAVWGGGSQVLDDVVGANGMGRHLAIALRGSASSDTTLIAIDVMFDSGGLL